MNSTLFTARVTVTAKSSWAGIAHITRLARELSATELARYRNNLKGAA
jgi:hypothetical protein